MKKIIIASLFALTTNAFALNTSVTIPNFDGLTFPGQTAVVAVVGNACDVDLSDVEGLEVDSVKNGRDVIYTITANGEVVAKAKAKRGLFFRTTCVL